MELLLAHQGGWDEALFVLVPLAFLAWLLRLAHVRAERLDDEELTGPTGQEEESGGRA